MDRHIKAIGILWIIYGGLGLLFTLFLFVTLFGVSLIPDMGHEAPIILRTVAIGIGIFFTILCLPELFAGIGLIKFREWGRILALIVSFLNLISFPVGTALAVYSLVILLNSEAIELFHKN